MQRGGRSGPAGLEVSRIGLGTMTWGDGTDADAATAQLTAFVDAGGTLVETADGYGDGAAQQMLGEVLAASVPREHLVLAGRGILPGGPLGDSALGGRAARGALLAGLDATLERARHRPHRPVAAARLSTPPCRWRRRCRPCRWP